MVKPVIIERGATPVLRQYGETINQMVTNPMLDGHLLENVTLAADGEITPVAHKLDRRSRGYFVVRQKYAGLEHYHYSQSANFTALTFSHGLGGTPTECRVSLECTTSNGWSVGDFVELPASGSYSNPGHYGIVVRYEASSPYDGTVDTRIAATGIVIIQPNRNTLSITKTSWDMHWDVWRRRWITESRDQAEDSKHLYLRGHGFTGNDKVDLWVF